MLEGMRKTIIGLTTMAERDGQVKLTRRAAVLMGKIVRLPKAGAQAALDGIDRTMSDAETEFASWVGVEAIERGEGGPFDALDLRIWIALAERAGVPCVPARTVLVLSQEEMELGSGRLRLPDNAVMRTVTRKLASLFGSGETPPTPAEMTEGQRREKLEEIEERLFQAMDGVPEGWMVRYKRAGGINLKALAGSGLAGPEVPEVRFGPDLEIGPGWVRVGNRRRVDMSDSRTVETAAQGPDGDHAFLARPWIEAARYAVGDDPHRHGSPFAGKGVWPAEWRAFVEKGRVVGVASYYGWCGSATPENARIAIEVRELAQKVVDEAVRQKAYPRYIGLELLRRGASDEVRAKPEVAQALADFGAEDVACTIDFIEAKDGGLTLLEGGPAHTPYGGGHLCAFAGVGGQPRFGARLKPEGVAFRLMPGVLLADMATWNEGDRTGAILTWDEVDSLAS